MLMMLMNMTMTMTMTMTMRITMNMTMMMVIFPRKSSQLRRQKAGSVCSLLFVSHRSNASGSGGTAAFGSS